MTEAVGLSVGAARCAGVALGRVALTRPSVPGLADPLVADRLRGLVHAVTDGLAAGQTPVVAYPAHWPGAAVEALRSALTRLPEWSRGAVTLVSDAAASTSVLRSDPGLPARGVIALCDFGGTGTSITLLDASRGYAPVGPTVRHRGFSGDAIDRALLAHVAAGLPGAVPLDGPLQRLRAGCRDAKERLSGATATALPVELPGFVSNVRITRSELDEVLRESLASLS